MDAPPNQSNTVLPARQEGAFRVLHTADWHLGKTLGDLDRSEEHGQFLDALFDLITRHHVQALLVAGDVFDSAHPPQTAVRQYFNFLTRVFHETACHVVITAGNHDSPGQIDAPRQALHALRVHVIGAMPAEVAQTLIPLPSAEEPQVVVAAVPFLRDRDLRSGQIGQSAADIQRALCDGLRAVYAGAGTASEPWKQRGVAAIALGHLTVLGSLTSDSERDIHVGGLGSVGTDVFPAHFNYVALGHLHRPQAVGGLEHVRYAGSPLPLSFSESGDVKEVRLLDFAQGLLVQNVGVALPVSRTLVRLEIPYAQVSTVLADYLPPDSPMPPWVEITVTEAPYDPGLMDRVRTLLEAKRCRLLRVIATREGGAAALGLDEDQGDASTDDLLGDPGQVFFRLLDQEPSLPPDDRQRLETAFAELHNLWTEQQRDAITPVEVAQP